MKWFPIESKLLKQVGEAYLPTDECRALYKLDDRDNSFLRRYSPQIIQRPELGNWAWYMIAEFTIPDVWSCHINVGLPKTVSTISSGRSLRVYPVENGKKGLRLSMDAQVRVKFPFSTKDKLVKPVRAYSDIESAPEKYEPLFKALYEFFCDLNTKKKN